MVDGPQAGLCSNRNEVRQIACRTAGSCGLDPIVLRVSVSTELVIHES